MVYHSSHIWQCRGRRFEIGAKPLVMGIVNVTPDSFSDGGRFLDPAIAVDHALKLVAEGADLLDIGGESTRPGSLPVADDEELRRVLPVVRELARRTEVPISVDTSKASVARACLDAGAAIINDVTGLRGDAEMPGLVTATRAGVIVMHMQGMPATMQRDPRYDDVVREVGDFFKERLRTLTDAGIAPEAMAFDPGFGFGKTMEHNLQLLANLDDFRWLKRPMVLGISRKGIVGTLTGRSREERMPGSLAVACFAVAANSAQVLRVHDVAPTRDAAVLYEAIAKYETPKPF